VHNSQRTVCLRFLVAAIDFIIDFDVDTLKPPTFCLRAPGKPAKIGKGPFVIAIVDPDAPAPEKADNATETVRHFLGGDFTFKDDGFCLANNTPAITEYEPPSPPKGSKPHRYVGY